MSRLDDVCEGVLRDVPESLGFAIVDLNSGLMLGAAHRVSYLTQEIIDAVAAAAVDMFRGRQVTAVEELIGAQRGVAGSRLIKEVQMTTTATYHYMSIVPARPDVLLVLISTRRANLGTGWATVHAMTTQLVPLLP